jgi:hypothetical protein
MCHRKLATVLCVLVWAVAGQSAYAQSSWSDKLFDTLRHDFGYVARGHFKKAFTITNNLNRPVHIVKAEPSCRVCTVAKPDKDLLQPGESTTLEVTIDTFSHTEKRDVAVTVTFDRPSRAQTRLNLYWKPRTDIVFNPPELRFGTVKRGTSAAQTMEIKYAGDPEWKIATATCLNSAFEVELQETQRETRRDGVGLVGYVMTVRLKADTPPSSIRDRIVLGINDVYNKTLDVALQGNVHADVTVSPASLAFGKVAADTNMAKQAVVRGVRPFKILQISGSEGPFEIEKPEEAKPLHVLTVRLKPGQEPGDAAQDFEIVTDMEGEAPLKLTVSATLLETPRPASGS